LTKIQSTPFLMSANHRILVLQTCYQINLKTLISLKSYITTF